MQQTTRELLEQEFAKHSDMISPTNEIPAVVVSDEQFAEAPEAYVGEIRELFKGLPLDVRKYLYTREGEFSKSLEELNAEVNARRFIDDAFNSKGSKRGFKNAREWIEHLILAEDLIEQNPAAVLQFLARVYGIDMGQTANADTAHFCAETNAKTDAVLNGINMLIESVSALHAAFEDKNKHEAELLAKAEEAKAAKDAAFSVTGHRSSDDDYSGLTTRQILERQFAQLDEQ